MFQPHRVADILLTARNGVHDYAVVRFADKGFGITRDGEAITGYYGPEPQLDECMDMFMFLAGIESDPPQSWSADADEQN